MLCLRLCRAQRRILEAIARGKRVAIRSGQKTGKSTSFVAAALWWAATRARGRVLLTAPVNKQVREVLWKELRRIVYAMRPDGRTVAEVLGVEPALQPSTGMQWPDGREIVGFTADSPSSMQGFSGPEMLIIVDEGSGVADDIFEAIEGNTAGGGGILAASNPNKDIGWFYEAFHSQREFWETIHLSSEETPNCTGDEPPIPGLADPAFVEQQRQKYGIESSWYQIRILGNFASKGANKVVGLGAVEAGHAAWRADGGDDRPELLELGVDAARFGDDESAIAPRRGTHLYPIETKSGADTIDVTGEVMRVVRMLRRPGERKVAVKIDTSGGYGGGIADLLRSEHGTEVEVHEINSSEKADDEERYTNRRAQLHFAVADWLADGGSLPPDKKLEVELLAPTYKFDARGRRQIESKDEIKKRIGRSPDRADALALAVLRREPGSSARTHNRDANRWGHDSRGFG